MGGRLRGLVPALVLVAATAAAALEAQPPAGRPPQPQPAADSARRLPDDTIPRDTLGRDTVPRGTAGRDSAGRDSAGRDSANRPLVNWAETDSVFEGLLARQGYAITRYQGEDVTFLVGSRRIVLTGDPGAVQQGEAVVVGDTIIYDDSTGQIEVRSGRNGPVTLRDPAQGQDDIRATWIRYNVRTGQGTVGRIATSVQSGETWHVSAERAGIFGAQGGDSATTRFYGHDGSITSCDLKEPHYHFEARNLKVVRGQIMVARPAVLYIGEVPVLWLPFVFQDMREGRRSGFLSPRFGVAELVRNSPAYRRSVDNLGYYFALSDYADGSVWLDWRSGARGDERDPGYWRYNGELGYNWLSWFMRGRLAGGYELWQGGRKNLTLSWQHNQQFSQRTSLNANVNYAQSTQLQRIGAYTPQAALATIRSQANFQTRRGPFSLSLGADRTQYTGQDKVDQTLPTLNVTAEPISLSDWLTWTPSFSLRNTQRLDYTDVGLLGTRFRVEDGRVLADTGRYDERTTTLDVQTPLKIFDFNWTNRVSVAETERNAPVRSVVYGETPGDSSVRIFARAFQTQLRWETGVNLPSFSPGRWNVTPSVNFSDVEGSAGFLVRSYLNGGEWVRQNKRPSFGLGTSPTFFRRYGGFGPFDALRHQVSPTLSLSYAPAGRVSNEFLQAIGQNPATYVGALQQAQLSLGLTTTIEAKMRPGTAVRDTAARDSAGGDSARPAAPLPGRSASDETVRLLTLRFSPLSYDFVRADTLGRGLTNETFSIDGETDLLPGFNARAEWSLFNGPATDIRSEFRPFLTGINASFSLNRSSNALALLSRVFGQAAPLERPGETAFDQTAGDSLAAEFARQPVAGQRSRMPVGQIPQGQGWRASLNFSMRRSRPADQLLGTVVEFDPELECVGFRADPLAFQDCVLRVSRNPPAQDPSTLPGATITRYPTQTSLGSQLSFDLTPNWTGSWQTSYDFTRNEFADHVVSLQRNLHDWRAVFAFTQSPNGNFAFSFYIALKAQPDLKLDYDQRSYRGQ